MSETNNNFDGLKRLLKLKQHEVPPPGYFNRFSGDVVSRIRAGESGGSQSIFEQFGSGSWGSLLQVFQAKPGVIGGFATSLCLLLLIGVVMADRPDGTSMAGDAGIAPSAPSDTSPLAYSSVPLSPAGDSGLTITTNSSIHSLQPMPALFGSQQNPLFQPASFMTAGQ
jgi:hypothetical protein